MGLEVQLATRGPVIETEHTALLDCGLVRAHAMHTLRVTLSNPTPLPVGLFVASDRDARSFSHARDGRSTGACAMDPRGTYDEVPINFLRFPVMAL